MKSYKELDGNGFTNGVSKEFLSLSVKQKCAHVNSDARSYETGQHIQQGNGQDICTQRN